MRAEEEKKYLEELAEYLYGKNWRETVTTSQWDTLIAFAAARELREVTVTLEKLMEREHVSPKPHKAGSLPRRNWSEASNTETKYAATLRQFIERTGNLSHGNHEAPPKPPVDS